MTIELIFEILCDSLRASVACCRCLRVPPNTSPRRNRRRAPLQNEILVLLSYEFLVLAESTNLQICLPETT